MLFYMYLSLDFVMKFEFLWAESYYSPVVEGRGGYCYCWMDFHSLLAVENNPATIQFT